MGPSHN